MDGREGVLDGLESPIGLPSKCRLDGGWARMEVGWRFCPWRRFGRRAPLTPQLKRASARRREEKVFMGVYMIQQVAAVHLGWGQAPSLDTENVI